MKLSSILTIFLFLIASCSKEKFPDKKSLRMNASENETAETFNPENADLQSLLNYLDKFVAEDENFSVKELIKEWEVFKPSKTINFNKPKDVDAWIEINGFLLELTGEERFASELEKIDQKTPKSDVMVKNKISEFVITKNVDHLFVNLFKNAEVEYQHSLGGKIDFTVETNYPESGEVKLHFNTTERRYIELYIRIPEWAEGTTVEVKKVKYFAQPGAYCKIAKKWKKDDLVEINFPIEKRTN